MKELRLPLTIATVFTLLFVGYVYLPDNFLHGKAKLTAIEELAPGTRFILADIFKLVVPPEYTVSQNPADVTVILPKIDDNSPYFGVKLEYDPENIPQIEAYLADYTETQTVSLSGFTGLYGEKSTENGVEAGYFFEIADRTIRISVVAKDQQSLKEAQQLLETGLMIKL